MILQLEPASCRDLKLSITSGLDTVERSRRRSDNCSKRSFSGITPVITSRDILWVDFIHPSAILRQRYCMRSSFIKCVLDAQWKHMQPYSKTYKIVVLYSLRRSSGCAPHQNPVTVRRKLILLAHFLASCSICDLHTFLLSNQTPRYLKVWAIVIFSPYKYMSTLVCTRAHAYFLVYRSEMKK